MNKSVGVASAVESILKEAPAADEAVKETPSKEAPASQPSDKGSSKSEADKPAADRTAFEQELIAELDEEGKSAFEASSPEEQTRFLTLAKKSYRRNSKEMTELGTLRKAVGALQDAGITNEDLVKLVQEKRGGTKAQAKAVVDSATNGKGGGKRGYQRWLDQAKTDEEREGLTDARQVLREEFDDWLAEQFDTRLDTRVKPLEERIALSDRERLTKRSQSLEQEINDLEDKHGYPGSLVETHREAMRRLGLREPDLSVEDLLVRVAGFKTVKAALDKMKQKGQEEEPPAPGGRAAPIVKKPAPVPMATDRKGRLSVMEAARSLLRPSK